jgi:hypothetical protein
MNAYCKLIPSLQAGNILEEALPLVKMLSVSQEESQTQRNNIFEEYVNGGLEILPTKLRGAACL